MVVNIENLKCRIECRIRESKTARTLKEREKSFQIAKQLAAQYKDITGDYYDITKR